MAFLANRVDFLPKGGGVLGACSQVLYFENPGNRSAHALGMPQEGRVSKLHFCALERYR